MLIQVTNNHFVDDSKFMEYKIRYDKEDNTYHIEGCTEVGRTVVLAKYPAKEQAETVFNELINSKTSLRKDVYVISNE